MVIPMRASVSRVQSLIALGRVAEAAAVTDGVSVERRTTRRWRLSYGSSSSSWSSRS